MTPVLILIPKTSGAIPGLTTRIARKARVFARMRNLGAGTAVAPVRVS